MSLKAPDGLKIKILNQNELYISWNDTNTYSLNENLRKLQKFYILQWVIFFKYNYENFFRYGVNDEFDNRNQLTVEKSFITLTNLIAGKQYEINVRIVLSDGTESPWSNKLIVKIPLNSIENNRKQEYCDFESFTNCDFINDVTATLEWKRKEIPDSGNIFYKVFNYF